MASAVIPVSSTRSGSWASLRIAGQKKSTET